MERISVIMPIYNNQTYICEALESVRSMDYPYMEIILVDDGSTDDSIKKIDTIINNDERISLHCHTENRGTASSIKTGIGKSTGEYIFIAAADDLSLPSRVTKILEVFRSNPKVGIVVSEGIIIDENSMETGEIYTIDNLVSNDNIAISQFKRNYTLGASMALRNNKSILLKDKVLETIDDYQISIEFLLSGYDIYLLPDALIKYRIHSENQSNYQGKLRKKNIHALKHYDICRIGDSLINRGFNRREILLALGVFELFRDNVKSAFEFLNNSLKEKGYSDMQINFEVYFYLGVVNYLIGEHQISYEYFLKALSIHKEPTVLNNTGVLMCLLNNDHEQAIEYIKRSLKDKPDYIDAKNNIDRANLGRICELKVTERLLEKNRIQRKRYIV